VNKKKLSIFLTVFFLVQNVSIPHALSQQTSLLNPPTRVSLNESQFCIKGLCDAICVGLFIYKYDTINGYPREKIKEECGAFISRSSQAKFDLDHMDVGRKGWTRYYPFSINDKNFIMRICLTSDLIHQPKVEVLYQDAMRDGTITFQILPGINEVLKDCRIKPHDFRYPAEVDRSP